VFVLGVYPSAFHASWHSLEGKRISPALAVADEPEPFWDGTGHEAVLERVAERVPSEAGTLQPAGEHNGRAGRALNEDYFEPLSLARDDVWIADIQNYYLASAGQVERIAVSYLPLAEAGVVPPAAIIPRGGRPSIDRLAEDRDPPLEAQWKEASRDWLITLGAEPVGVLGLVDLRKGEYGEPRCRAYTGGTSRTWRSSTHAKRVGTARTRGCGTSGTSSGCGGCETAHLVGSKTCSADRTGRSARSAGACDGRARATAVTAHGCHGRSRILFGDVAEACDTVATNHRRD
jgi:hypothetical protein